ncbi:MAG: PAS domain-containing protein, partial [Candidatus Obscuribacterales bacterium]|nr:PAS domain-containing protein [Candidatus Obscuribacterales bacterium]
MKIGIIDESGEKLAHIERCLGDCPSGTRPRLVRFETYIEAIAELEDQQISLIFATNGGETWTLSSLVEAQSDVPVVALIERMEPKLIEQVLFSGVHDYLVMDGLNAATVLHVCQSVVARYSAHASFEQVIRSIREGVLLVDESNTIQFANASACSMLGFSFEQLLGSPFDIDTCEYVLVETLITRTDGSVVPAELRKSPLASGPAGLFLVSIRDLTDKLVANTRIQSLERNARYKDEMFASMTHELRTPLSAISNISEKLARASSEKPSPSRLVNLLHISTEALMTVVNDVLDLSKLEAGKLSIEETIFSPMSIISEIESIMSPHSREKNLLLSKAVSADLPSFVVGDPNRVRQVLLNLVSNAIKYTEQGRVEIRAWTQTREDGSVNLRFEVED